MLDGGHGQVSDIREAASRPSPRSVLEGLSPNYTRSQNYLCFTLTIFKHNIQGVH